MLIVEEMTVERELHIVQVAVPIHRYHERDLSLLKQSYYLFRVGIPFQDQGHTLSPDLVQELAHRSELSDRIGEHADHRGSSSVLREDHGQVDPLHQARFVREASHQVGLFRPGEIG